MRRSKQATAESRRKITQAASKMFRANGFERVSVADVMQAADMTQGGFYRHFPSKEALVAEAMAHAFGECAARLEVDATIDDASGFATKLGSYVDDYLSTKHITNPEQGCPMAATGSEVPRVGAEVCLSFDGGAEQLAQRLTKLLGEASPTPREAALRLLSSLVGTIVIARAVGAGSLQDEVLAAMRADPVVKNALDSASS
jgi:TetR/AcrR family transcriptional regulator, transcriptional repressor for nem operon